MADAKIFLSDCLACDSCVSAEEGVQVAQQNAKDFLRVLNLNKVQQRGRRRGRRRGRQAEAKVRHGASAGAQGTSLALSLCPLPSVALRAAPQRNHTPRRLAPSLTWQQLWPAPPSRLPWPGVPAPCSGRSELPGCIRALHAVPGALRVVPGVGGPAHLAVRVRG